MLLTVCAGTRFPASPLTPVVLALQTSGYFALLDSKQVSHREPTGEIQGPWPCSARGLSPRGSRGRQREEYQHPAPRGPRARCVVGTSSAQYPGDREFAAPYARLDLVCLTGHRASMWGTGRSCSWGQSKKSRRTEANDHRTVSEGRCLVCLVEQAAGTGACGPLHALPSVCLAQGAGAVRPTACGVGFPPCWGPRREHRPERTGPGPAGSRERLVVTVSARTDPRQPPTRTQGCRSLSPQASQDPWQVRSPADSFPRPAS